MFVSTESICEHTFVTRFIHADSIVLDLGANEGEFAHRIIERFGCRVISAEPLIELCDKIDLHPSLRLLNTAVGGKNQDVTINVFSERCASVHGPVTADEYARKRTVPMVTLAEFRRLASVDHVDLLKLDIEGAEIDLFGSCSDSELKEIGQITVEFHSFIYADQHHSVLQIEERLADLGFWVVPFRLDHSDVLFVNRSTGISAAEIAYMRTFVKSSKAIMRRLRRTASSVGLLDDSEGYCKIPAGRAGGRRAGSRE
ncbi:MAG: FkbM family methyltransferase [Terracidiphilus sp.]